MDKRQLFLFISIKAGIALASSAPENLQQKSLEDVRSLREQKLTELSSTKEFKKLERLWDQFGKMRLETAPLAFACTTWGSRCDQALEMDQKMHEHKKRIDHAERKLKEINPGLRLIEECLMEKQYEEMDVEEECKQTE